MKKTIKILAINIFLGKISKNYFLFKKVYTNKIILPYCKEIIFSKTMSL